jgi:ubiquinone/menaquinone biosynthesis C-methylase UbiE
MQSFRQRVLAEPGGRQRRRAFGSERMSPVLDELSLQFVIHSRSANGVVADIGCGDGIATAAALVRGAHVHAIDPNEDSLRRMLERVPNEQHARLTVSVGSLPNMTFAHATFAAIHAAYVLHLLDGDVLERALRQFARWLCPGGKLFLSALTPSGDFWLPVRERFARRLSAGVKWPGYIADASRFVVDGEPEAFSVHLLDERILRRALQASGFVIDAFSWYTVPWDRAQVCCGVIASCDHPRSERHQ